MGRARKTNKQKSDAKRANDRNMEFMENLQQQAVLVPETKPKKKRGTRANVPPSEPSEIEPDPVEDTVGSVVNSMNPTCDIEPDIPEDLSVIPKSIPTAAIVTDVPEDLRINSAAIPVQPTFAGHNVSVIKVVLDCEENPYEVVDEDIVMNAPDCNAIKELEKQVAALSLEIESLKQENARLRSLNEPGENQVPALASEVESLKEENARLHSLNMKLQEALMERPNGNAFKEIPGFPDAKWLLSVSQNAEGSDYLFVKELVFNLFPLGVGNATVSGHQSNNPYGRGSRNGLEIDARANVERLDPEKVQYIRDRLHERRLILQDELGVAVKRSRKTARHIAAVINNNPSLRTLRQQ